MNDGKCFAVLGRGTTRRQVIAGVTMAFGALALAPASALAQATGQISHAAESIHQEVIFKASRKRLYETLTDAKQFERVVQLSDAMKTRMKPGAPPAQISPQEGGSFLMFGGLIAGRHIELVPDARIVQAWRPVYWTPGVYSIVRFELSDSGTGTKIVLDQRGFPDGEAQSLYDGWNENYWQPLAKYLA
jgi:activator of HSP90 ATPase